VRRRSAAITAAVASGLSWRKAAMVVVGRQLTHEPERRQVAHARPFKVARRPDLIEITLNVGPHHVGRMIARMASGGCNTSVEGEVRRIQADYNEVDDTDQRSGRDIIFNAG